MPDVVLRPIPLAQTRMLRHAVLRPHLTVDELTADEPADAFAVGAFDGEQLVAVGLVGPEGDPGTWRVRDMATAPHARRHGAGTSVLDALLRHAAAQGATRVWCNARTSARSLYERAGFSVASDEFESPEIGPQFVMELSISGRRRVSDIPGVSVIIATYQRREFVLRAVASVLAQTYRDFELIVIDDGSTDGTPEALAPHAERLRYHWRPHDGVAAARNAGLQLARGSIIAFLDSDNQWLPNHLAVVAEALERHPNAVLASTCPDFIVAGRERASEARLVDYRTQLIFDASRAGFLSGIAVRAAALANVGRFDERMMVLEDSDLLIRLATLGPFSVVRHRTIVRQETSGSLRERGRRAGEYLTAAELSARNLASAVARLPEAERATFLEQARGMEHFALALRALDRGDAGLVREHLEHACRVLPLSDVPVRVSRRVDRHLTRSHERGERLRAYTLLAEVWPHESSDTARYMRLLAMTAAVRARRPLQAARMLTHWPRGKTLQFASRLAAPLLETARRTVAERRHRGQEASALLRSTSCAISSKIDSGDSS